MAQKRSAALPFILVTLLLDVLGIGLIIPVLPKLVTTMGGGNISENSGLFGWFVAIYASMQFLFSPVLGSLSDTYGRRPVILLSLVGAGLDYLLLAFAPSLEWLFVGRVISGITGANMTAINAYVADVSPPVKRAQNYGLMGAMFGIGFILGPAVADCWAAWDRASRFWRPRRSTCSMPCMAFLFFRNPWNPKTANRSPCAPPIPSHLWVRWRVIPSCWVLRAPWCA